MSNRLCLAIALALLAGASSLYAQAAADSQALSCGTTTGSSAGCESHHYHLAIYRFDSKSYLEGVSVNEFATPAGCEAARAAELRQAQTLATFMRSRQPKNPIELMRVGACHCNMTTTKTHPRFMDDGMRARHIRSFQDGRAALRERLLDMAAPPDVVRALSPLPASFPGTIWSKAAAPIDAPRDRAVDTASVTMKQTDVTKELSRPIHLDVQLPLAGLANAASPPPANATEPPPAETTIEADPDVVALRAQEPIPSTQPEPEAATIPEEGSSTEPFMDYESSRLQSIIAVSANISDDDIRMQIGESVDQRSRVLENLVRIIEGAGTKSRLAQLAREAMAKPQDLELVRRLFGPVVTEHWAPKDARDAIIDFPRTVSADPEAVLRDTGGRFSQTEKQAALYLVLNRDDLTSSQESWLTPLVEQSLASSK